MPSVKNLQTIFQKIIDGTAPPKFNQEHLTGLGFKSSNDRAIIPLLKDLGFLSEDGTPTSRYHEYRDKSKSRAVLGEAIKEAYADLFHVKEKPTTGDREAIQGKFKSTHNVSDRVAEAETSTFFALLKLADIDAAKTPKRSKDQQDIKTEGSERPSPTSQEISRPPAAPLNLRYNIEIHLPATKDIEVYNAIFKSLREHLGD